jgi:hypothetical protein
MLECRFTDSGLFSCVVWLVLRAGGQGGLGAAATLLEGVVDLVGGALETLHVLDILIDQLISLLHADMVFVLTETTSEVVQRLGHLSLQLRPETLDVTRMTTLISSKLINRAELRPKLSHLNTPLQKNPQRPLKPKTPEHAPRR